MSIYVNQLPDHVQAKMVSILEARGFTQEDIENMQDSKVSDLSDTFTVRELLAVLEVYEPAEREEGDIFAITDVFGATRCYRIQAPVDEVARKIDQYEQGDYQGTVFEFLEDHLGSVIEPVEDVRSNYDWSFVVDVG